MFDPNSTTMKSQATKLRNSFSDETDETNSNEMYFWTKLLYSRFAQKLYDRTRHLLGAKNEHAKMKDCTKVRGVFVYRETGSC